MFQRIGRFFQRNMLIVISSEQSEWRDLIPVISTNVERSLHALRLVEMTGGRGVETWEGTKMYLIYLYD